MRPEYILGIVLVVIVGAGLLVLPAGKMQSAASTIPGVYPKYNEIAKPAGFVNSDPFQLKDVVGKKVILLDFVTYSCINCQRTFPYLNKWYEEYKDDGLLIVGIHTPEFAFEHDINNVRAAAAKFGLKFPLVLDNEYATWNAYGNQYWPRKYLIDIHGNIVYDHIGEGNYDETEVQIVKALNERKQFLAEGGGVVAKMDTPKDAPNFDPSMVKSPETYLGGARAQYLVNSPSSACASGTCTYKYKGTDVPQGYQLSGSWMTDKEYITLTKGTGAIRISFNANKVNLVAGADQAVRARIMLDGKDLGLITIKESILYVLADLTPAKGEPLPATDHILEIQFLDPGVKAYAFTFG